MSDPDPGATKGPQQPVQDTQNLIAQLTSLMPLLLQLQAQALQPTPQSAPADHMIQNPMLDYQASVDLVEDITAGSLRVLSSYLEAHYERNAGLKSCVPMVTQAAHCFAARDFAQAFGLIWQVYRIIATLRAVDPQLPAVHAREGAAPFSPLGQTVH